MRKPVENQFALRSPIAARHRHPALEFLSALPTASVFPFEPLSFPLLFSRRFPNHLTLRITPVKSISRDIARGSLKDVMKKDYSQSPCHQSDSFKLLDCLV